MQKQVIQHPFQVDGKVRVLIYRDPRLSPAEQNQLKKRFTFKKFAMSHWTKDHFIIAQVQSMGQYVLQGFPQQSFHHSELQLVA